MANITVIFRHPQYSSAKKEKYGFWENFFNAADRVRGEYTEREDNFEGRLKVHFPHELKRLLSTFTPPVSTVGLEAKTNLSASIAIAVEYIREGSLEMGLVLEPVEKLAKLFDNNFEYFETFLRAYIPIAFLNSLQPAYRPEIIGWGDVVNQLEFDLTPSNDFRNQFQAIGNLSSPNPNNSVRAKANWLWVISNTSLVLPVVIVAILLYLAFNRLTIRENQIDVRFEKMIEHQDKFINRLLNENDSISIQKNRKLLPAKPISKQADSAKTKQ